MARAWGLLISGLALAACLGCIPFAGSVYDEQLDGPFRLIAIDSMEDMAIFWTIPEGGFVGDGLPGPTVLAAGHDARFLVAAVHPEYCKPFDEGCKRHGSNPHVTEYWYVIRQPDERERLPYAGIKGPFSQAAFAAEKRRLGLPEFSVHFRELE
jgi:hypothetical protein